MSLRQHIAAQFPSLFITLVSILVAIFFDDLFSEARSRMVLWPLDVGTLRRFGVGDANQGLQSRFVDQRFDIGPTITLGLLRTRG